MTYQEECGEDEADVGDSADALQDYGPRFAIGREGGAVSDVAFGPSLGPGGGGPHAERTGGFNGQSSCARAARSRTLPRGGLRPGGIVIEQRGW